MRWSYKVGRLAGVDIYLHATFLLLLVWIGVSHWLASRSLSMTITGLLLIIALFGCVLLHELGHAVAAARYGIPTRDIILLPIGGLARLERMPEKPSQELVVALAGPAVNLVIAAALYLWLRATGGLVPIERLSVASGSIVERLLVANLFILLFNLIPAFPMDGGRVLRALLAMRTDFVRATRVAAAIGQGLALLFGLVGLFTNPFLVFIALFVWIGAAQEAAAAQTRSALAGVALADIVERDVPVLEPGDPLERAVSLTLNSAHKDFPVVLGERVVGVITQSAMLRALAAPGERPPVGTIMEREIVTVDIDELAPEVFAKLQQCRCRTLPVTEDGRLVGVVTLENVGELLAIKSALAAGGRDELPIAGEG